MTSAPPNGAVIGTPDWSPAVLNALYEQAFATPDVETAGILVGHGVQPAGTTKITALIPAVRCDAPHQRALLTHEVWAYVHETMGRHYATQDIVGWYLSRPDGIYLTDQDRATHQRFFSSPGQVALVFNSHAQSGGIFAAGADGSVQMLYEGPVTHAYQAPAPDTSTPWRGAAALAAIGLILGSVLWLAAGATGLI
jgi:hypothetical protein